MPGFADELETMAADLATQLSAGVTVTVEVRGVSTYNDATGAITHPSLSDTGVKAVREGVRRTIESDESGRRHEHRTVYHIDAAELTTTLASLQSASSGASPDVRIVDGSYTRSAVSVEIVDDRLVAIETVDDE